jgi:hypothetical protein
MTDFRALCAELLEALENAIRVIYHEDGTKHISTADPVIAKADAALAQPEPQGPTDEELTEMWMEQYGIGSATMSVAEFKHAIRDALARWSRPAIEPVPQQGE